jgi:hypothetical protein
MPTVPYISEPRVNPSPLPGARVSTEAPIEAFGGGAAAQQTPDLSGAQHALGAIAAIEREEQAKADAVVVDQARFQLGEAKLAAKSRLQQLQGTDALTAPEPIAADWKKTVGDIGSGLNARQRELFQPHVASETLDLDETMQRHVFAQRQALDADTFDANTKLAYQDALDHAGDDFYVRHSIDMSAAQTREFAQRHGMPAEWTAAKIADQTSAIHMGVVNVLTAGEQDLTAKAYFDANKGELHGADLIHATAAVEEGSSRAESQRQADSILANTSTLGDAVQAARKIQDPRVRELTIQQVREAHAINQQDQREQAENNMVTAGNLIDHFGSVSKIPPAMWSQFSPSQKSELESYADGKRGGGVQTDWQTYYDLRTLASSAATHDEFLKTNLLDYMGRLAPAQLHEMIDLQAGLRKGEDAAGSKLQGIQTREQVVTSAIHGIGLGFASSPNARKQEGETIAMIRRSVDTQAELEEQRTQKPVSTADVQRIVDDIVTQHVVSSPGWLWGTNTSQKRLYELGPNDQLVLTSKDIPLADRRALTSALRGRGLPVTEESLVNAYRSYLSGLVNRGPR